MVVVHYTAMMTCDAARDRLCDAQAEVSAHYLIAEDGAVHALVPEELRAWHAGAGAWGQAHDVNSRSIGIELANDGRSPFPEPQIVALEALLADILHRWSIAPERVIGHSDMAPGRKSDPGALFPWARLAQAGLSVWPDVAGAGTLPFHAAARSFGYPEADPELVLAAFRLRFRPDASGPADATDTALANDLATRFPVDVTNAQA